MPDSPDSAARLVGVAFGVLLLAISLPFAIQAYPETAPSAVLWNVAWDEADAAVPQSLQLDAAGQRESVDIRAEAIVPATATVLITCQDDLGTPPAPAAVFDVIVTHHDATGAHMLPGSLRRVPCADAADGVTYAFPPGRPDFGPCDSQGVSGCVRAANLTQASAAIDERLGDRVTDATVTIEVSATRGGSMFQVVPAALSIDAELQFTKWVGTPSQPPAPPQEVLR